jgi:TPR repeat protein
VFLRLTVFLDRGRNSVITNRRKAAECGPMQRKKMMQAAYDYLANDASGSIPLPGPDSSGDELFRMGMLYSTGQGGAPLDYVSAHMLFNLAALRGSEAAKERRRELSQEMDRDSVAEAQRAAREWLQRA